MVAKRAFVSRPSAEPDEGVIADDRKPVAEILGGPGLAQGTKGANHRRDMALHVSSKMRRSLISVLVHTTKTKDRNRQDF